MQIYMKTYAQLVGEALALIAENTPITNMSPGGIARSLVEILCSMMGEFYSALEFKSLMSALSTSQGVYLDAIGQLVNVTRESGESDDNFRYRIAHAGETENGSNLIAQRLQALSIDNVRDVEFIPFTHGAGSRTIRVIVEDLSRETLTIQQVEDTLTSTQAAGIKTVVIAPIRAYVDMEVRLVMSGTSTSQAGLARNAAKAVESYILSLYLGQPMIISEIIYRIKNIDSSIYDVQLMRISINGRQVPFSNYYPNIEERLWPRTITVV